MKSVQSIIKRVFDFTISLLLLIVLLPLLLVLSVLIFWKLGWPILFAQKRSGKNGRPFTLYKFRTMVDEAKTPISELSDEQRLTPLGRFLRKTSLDELPEFINVIRGDMSLVGPRPLLTKYMDRYSREQARRHEVKPGISGWAQINGRNGISWEEKFLLDIWYVDHWNLWLDLKILAMTALKVIKQEGISQEGKAGMEEFKGSG